MRIVLTALVAGLVLAVPAPKAEGPDAASLSVYDILNLDLSTPDKALEEIASFMQVRDDLRLRHALAPKAYQAFLKLIHRLEFDRFCGPCEDDPQAFSDALGLFAPEFTLRGGPDFIAIGNIDYYFPVMMSAARSLGGLPADLRGAARAGPIVQVEGDLPRVRFPVTGPHLWGVATVWFEQSPSGRWRLLGVRIETPDGPWDWLAVPQE